MGYAHRVHMGFTSSSGARPWRRNLVLIGLLMAAWTALSFGPAYFARDLLFPVFGWPFSFWMAAYGAPLGYLVLVGVYAFIMNRAERRPPGQDG